MQAITSISIFASQALRVQIASKTLARCAGALESCIHVKENDSAHRKDARMIPIIQIDMMNSFEDMGCSIVDHVSWWFNIWEYLPKISVSMAVSEIKLLFCALTGCTSPKNLHPEIAP